MEYIKNPIVLGLIASAITYLYLKWDEYKNKNDEFIEKKRVSMLHPILFGLTVFLGVTIWKQFGSNNDGDGTTINKIILETSSQLNNKLNNFSKSLPHVFIETS